LFHYPTNGHTCCKKKQSALDAVLNKEYFLIFCLARAETDQDVDSAQGAAPALGILVSGDPNAGSNLTKAENPN